MDNDTVHMLRAASLEARLHEVEMKLALQIRFLLAFAIANFAANVVTALVVILHTSKP